MASLAASESASSLGESPSSSSSSSSLVPISYLSIAEVMGISDEVELQGSLGNTDEAKEANQLIAKMVDDIRYDKEQTVSFLFGPSESHLGGCASKTADPADKKVSTTPAAPASAAAPLPTPTPRRDGLPGVAEYDISDYNRVNASELRANILFRFDANTWFGHRRGGQYRFLVNAISDITQGTWYKHVETHDGAGGSKKITVRNQLTLFVAQAKTEVSEVTAKLNLVLSSATIAPEGTIKFNHTSELQLYHTLLPGVYLLPVDATMFIVHTRTRQENNDPCSVAGPTTLYQVKVADDKIAYWLYLPHFKEEGEIDTPALATRAYA